MFHKGYIAPAAPSSRLNPPPLHMFNITQRGRTWLGGGDPCPEDAERYMTFLRAHIPTLDPVIDQYVVEALAAFGKEALFASAVMLGADIPEGGVPNRGFGAYRFEGREKASQVEGAFRSPETAGPV